MSNPQVTISVTATDTARATLDGVDQKIRSTSGTIETESTKIESRTAKLAGAFTKNFASIASTTAALGAGIVSFASSFSSLEKAQLSSDKANLAYQKSLERLSEMQNSGKASATELANQQEAVRIASEKAKMAQDDLGETYLGFLANVPVQLISFGTSAVGIFNLLRTTQIANSAASVASAATYNGALASMNVATATTTSAMGAFRIASIAAFMTNPVTLAIMGISVVVLLLVTHFDEVTAAVKWLGGVIYDFLAGAVNALIDGINFLTGGVFNLKRAFAEEMPQATATAGQALDGVKASVAETITVTDGLQVSVKRAGDETEAQTSRMSTSWQKLTSDIEMQVSKIKTVVREIPNPIGANLRVTSEVSDPVYFGSTLASQIAVKNSAPSIVAPSNFGTGSTGLGTKTGNTNYLNSISGTPSKKKAARGMNEILAQDTVIYAHKGEHASIRPGVSGTVGSSGDVVHIHLELNGREIAVASIADIKDLLVKDARVEAKARKTGIYGAG